MRTSLPFIIVVLCACDVAYGQNLDLTTKYASGENRGMAGVGIGSVLSAAAFDLDPSSLARAPSYFGSITELAAASKYDLNTTNSGIPSFLLDWGIGQLTIPEMTIGGSVGEGWGIGAGYVHKIAPLLQSQLRAITGSTMLNQKTSGSVDGFAFGLGGSVTDNVLCGVSIYWYHGTLTSDVQGDSHGADLDKSAFLKTKLQGWSLRGGMRYGFGPFVGGVVCETPVTLSVMTNSGFSNDGKYASLIPTQVPQTWQIPFSFGIGASYEDSAWTVALDVRTRSYQQSGIRVALYDLEGEPIWGSVTELRLGLRVYPFSKRDLPLMVGYGYLPQLYSSSTIVGKDVNNLLQVVSLEHTGRNITHLLTAGTSFRLPFGFFHAGLEYAKTQWTRLVSESTLKQQEYTEKKYVYYMTLEMLF
ncbi:MAG: hypothetical protein WBD36_10925 [Bacteroidota bacterium]